ncbi:ABC transporter substrate-binding protein [Cohnella sp. 56]|uniref:ABC transporter substrate-binding protein n=1 Tax=Cohnella sp. 56 TaxID=3113722 RepID=UPI0030E94D37
MKNRQRARECGRTARPPAAGHTAACQAMPQSAKPPTTGHTAVCQAMPQSAKPPTTGHTAACQAMPQSAKPLTTGHTAVCQTMSQSAKPPVPGYTAAGRIAVGQAAHGRPSQAPRSALAPNSRQKVVARLGLQNKKAIAIVVVACALGAAAAVWLAAGIDRAGSGMPSTADPSSSAGASAAGASPSAPPSGAAATDTIVMAFPAGTPRDLRLVEDEMSRYLAKKINAGIKLKPIDMGSWWDKTGLMFASGEQIDLMFTAGWMRFGDEVAKGRFIPLDDLLAQYGKGIGGILSPAIIEAGKVNGSVYGIVANKEFASSKGLVMRKDLVDKYGIDLSAVRTLADLTPVFAKIKQHEPDLYPLQARADRSPLTFLLQYGLFDMLGDGPGVLPRSGDSRRVVNLVDTPEFEANARLMYAWNRAGYLNPDATVSKDSEYEAVKAGRAFAFAESLKPGFEIQASRNTGMPMTTVELTKPYTTTADTTSAMFAISKNARHPEKAMMLLNLLYTDPYLLNLLDWGIEGKHYVKRADGQIEYPAGVDAKTVGYNLNQSWMFGNQLNSYLWSNEDPQLWAQYRAFNAAADKSQALGFVFDPEKVKNEIAACASVDEDFGPAVNTGALDPDVVLPMYRQKLKEAGAELVIAEKQRQLDAWLAQRGDSR